MANIFLQRKQKNRYYKSNKQFFIVHLHLQLQHNIDYNLRKCRTPQLRYTRNHCPHIVDYKHTCFLAHFRPIHIVRMGCSYFQYRMVLKVHFGLTQANNEIFTH